VISAFDYDGRKMKAQPKSVVLLCLAVACLSPAFAESGTWTTPVSLSIGGQGWESAAAMDAAGNSIALWDERTTQDQLWSRSKPAGGNWGHVAPVSAALQTTLVFPAVHMTANGFATAVWTDSTGIWTADRLSTGKWNPPQLLGPEASGPLFAMNARGDAVVAWAIDGPSASQNSVMAALRPAGQSWTSPQILATSAFIAADQVGISENGDVIVAWETFIVICREGNCFSTNFALHTSRNNGQGWAHTGILLGPDDESHIAHVALDAGGHALLLALNSSGAYVSAIQGPTGNTWSTFNTAVFVNGLTLESGLASDFQGNVTMVYETINLTTSQAFAISGSIADNTWSPPVLLSGADANVSQIYFEVAPNGVGAAIWLSSSGTPEIHAIIRTGSIATWSAPVTVSAPGSTEISPEAAAVSASGSAIIIYSGYNQADVHTEYVSNYTP